MTEEMGYKVTYTERNMSVITTSLALLVLRPDPGLFRGLAFGIASYNRGVDLKVRAKCHLGDHWLYQTILPLSCLSLNLTWAWHLWAYHLSPADQCTRKPFQKGFGLCVFAKIPEELPRHRVLWPRQAFKDPVQVFWHYFTFSGNYDSQQTLTQQEWAQLFSVPTKRNPNPSIICSGHISIRLIEACAGKMYSGSKTFSDVRMLWEVPVDLRLFFIFSSWCYSSLLVLQEKNMPPNLLWS